ncbi:MAG TPA: GAF domain-containing protein, partial [Candidatus Aquilonibacter sp.]
MKSGFTAQPEHPEVIAPGVSWEDLAKRLDRERQARLDAEERIQLLLAAASAGSVEDALRSALDRICTYTGWPVGHAYFVDAATGELVPSVWHLEKPELFESFRLASEERRFSTGVGLPGRVLEHGTPAWIKDVTRDDNFPRTKAAKDISVRGGFGFPVLAGEEVVAVLEFFSDVPAEPDLPLLETMAHIGGQLGRVIERQRILDQLESARSQLVVHERLAALGSLTAGIAHEIRNPLNFVTNFAEVAIGLVAEIQESLNTVREQLDPEVFANVAEIVIDVQTNVAKIQEHGKRANGIVRNMLMHSRGQTGVRQATNLNALISEYIRLAYHGLRAQDASFNVMIEEEYDSTIEPISTVIHDLSLVFVNIASNACY